MRNVLTAICVCGFVTAVAVSLAPVRAEDDADQLEVRIYPVADLPVWSLGADKPEFNPSVLMAHIKSTVDPDSWKDAAIVDHKNAELACLVVRQTKANHDKVADVIRSLRPKHPGEQREEIDENGVIRTSPPNPTK